MRPFLLSVVTGALLVGATEAQTSSDSGNMPQLPVGQSFKQFEFPVYADGKIKYTLFAIEAKGITLNRAETTELKIDVFDDKGAKTTTITSPKADLYVAEQKMRTKNTVCIERADMEATSQDCDFDVKNKKFLMRTNVKVLLKHFDVGKGLTGTNAPAATPPGAPSPSATGTAPSVGSATEDAGASAPLPPTHPDESILPSPGAYSSETDTNAAPIPPSRFK
jgi:hypothetical protein